MTELSELLNVRAGKRAEAMQAWFTRQPDAGEAARALAEWLTGLDSLPHLAPGSNATSAQIFVLEAEGLRFVLDEAAEVATDAKVAAQLWAYASTSASILLELADLPYCYARKAVLADPESELAWGCYQSSLVGYTTDFFEDVETWKRQVERGELAAGVVEKALASASLCARDWEEDDREMLAMLVG